MIAKVVGNLLTVEDHLQLVQGSVGDTLELSFSDDWAGLTATAVFSVDGLTRDVAVTGSRIVIPWELLQHAERRLMLNFHGAGADGRIVQTNEALLGRVKRSTAPSGQEPEAPSPVRADQIQALAEQAMAISAGLREDADAGRFTGEEGFSPSVSVQTISGGHRVTITDKDGAQSFDVMDGEGGTAVIDDTLDAGSGNPVRNSVLTAALNAKASVSPTQFSVSGNSVSLAMSFSRVIALPNNLYQFTGDANSPIELGFFRLTSFDYIESPYSVSFTGTVNGELYEIVLCGEESNSKPMTGTIAKRGDPGKISAPAAPAAGAFLVWDGSAWAAQTLAVWQGGSY